MGSEEDVDEGPGLLCGSKYQQDSMPPRVSTERRRKERMVTIKHS